MGKLRILDKGNEARRAARKAIGKPPATRKIEDGRHVVDCTCDKPQLRCPLHDTQFTEEEIYE